MVNKKQHWENRYSNTNADKLTWYQPKPTQSLKWIHKYCEQSQPLIDVGAGASTLCDHLIEDGYTNITLLDLSEESLKESQERLGNKANAVKWISADITNWQAKQKYALWHDRAVFHFLTDAEDRIAYKQVLVSALKDNGIFIMATFAIGGPEKCSGLPIVQYDTKSLQAELGGQFRLLESTQEDHPTPAGNKQAFNWCIFKFIGLN